jgi:hypothetical protein
MSFETQRIENDIQRLRDDLATLEYSLYGYGTPGYNMNKYKTTSSRYAEAKKEFDKEFPKYQTKKKQLETQISSLKTKLDTITKKEETTKKAEKAKEAIDKAKDDLQRAKDARDAEAQKAAEEELKTARIKRNQAEGTATVVDDTDSSKNGMINIAADKYSGYTIDKDGKITNKNGNPVLLVETKDAQGNIVLEEKNSTASARKVFLDQYSQPGQIDGLKKQLVSSGYLTPTEAKSADWIFGVDDLISAYTKQEIVDVQYGGAKQPKTIAQFIKEKRAGAGGDGSKTYYEYSSRGDASRMLDGYFNDLLGFGATPEQEDAFFKEVNAAQAKASRTVTDGRVGRGGFLTDADLLLIAAKVAKKAIKNTDLDLILKSGQGSQVAMDIADLQTTANEYGIDMPAAEALKYVVAGVGQKDYLLKQQERLRQLSMTMHPYLKDHIAAGGTVKDVADQYAKRKAAKLGVTVTESIKDPDIMNAVANNMSTAAFDIEMQKKPEWRFTSEAKQVADEFANTMLQTWGLG